MVYTDTLASPLTISVENEGDIFVSIDTVSGGVEGVSLTWIAV